MIPIKRLCSKIIFVTVARTRDRQVEQSNCFPVSALVRKIRLTQKQPDEYRGAARLLLASLHKTKFLPLSSCDLYLQSHWSSVICVSVQVGESPLKSE